MDREIAVAAVAAPAPGVEGNTHAACHTARLALPAWMPLLFPAHQVGRNGQLLAVNILTRLRDVEILAEKFDRIHVQLGREVIQGAHSNDRCLRMVRRPPGSCRTNTVADGSVLLALVVNCEYVRDGRHAAATGTSCAPRVRLPGNNGATLCPTYS